MKTIQSQEATLTTNEALVLQQVYEDGGDDAVNVGSANGYAASNGDECVGGFAA